MNSLSLVAAITCCMLSACGQLATQKTQPVSLQKETPVIGTKPVYGNDNRIELVNAGRTLCHAGRSVPALVHRNKLRAQKNNTWTLLQNQDLEDAGWCPNQRFSTQPIGVHCSAILIAPNRIVTAAHCVNTGGDPGGPTVGCEDLAIVFDHRVNADGYVPDRYESNQVYFCKKILDDNDFSGVDLRIVQLDRQTTRDPLPLLLTMPANLQQLKLDIIGHPLGLPLKAAIDGKLRKLDNRQFFLANIDAFEGNSGSPVMIQHEDTSVVIGMLSSGEIDGKQHSEKACKVARACSGKECSGERVIASTLFADWSSRNAESLETFETKKPAVKSLCF